MVAQSLLDCISLTTIKSQKSQYEQRPIEPQDIKMHKTTKFTTNRTSQNH